MPSKEAQERMEDQHFVQLMWSLRNLYLPEALGGERNHPPGFPNAQGWRYRPWTGSWEPPPEYTHYFRNPDGGQWSWSSGNRDR